MKSTLERYKNGDADGSREEMEKARKGNNRESLSSVGDTASWCKVNKRNGINEMTFDEGGNKRRRFQKKKKKINGRQVEGSV